MDGGILATAISPTVALILLTAGVVQGAVGFGYSLVATPLLVWAGASAVEAVALVSLTVAAQVALGVWRLRAAVPWRATLSASLLRWAFLPLGVWLLTLLDGLERDRVKQLLGALVLLALALQLLPRLWRRLRGAPRTGGGAPGRRWGALAFAASGVMQGLAAMGGPPAVMWAVAQPWEALRLRGFLQALQLLALPLQLLVLALALGERARHAFGAGLGYLPLVLAASWLGLKLGDGLPRGRLRALALSLLLATAGASLLGPLLG